MATADPPRAPALRVTVCAPAGAGLRVRGLGSWLSRVAPARARGDVSIAVVSDREIRRLNRVFRGVDRTTDVLSFPAGPAVPARRDRRRAGARALGDIAIAAGVARRQARAAGHGVQTEARVLALHGLLHLLGYDHEDRSDAGRMARLERQLRRKGGLPAGLIERARS